MKLSRGEWIDLAEYCLNWLKHSNHDKNKTQAIEEFLSDLETLIAEALEQYNT